MHLEEAREQNLAQEREARVAAERSVKQYDDFLATASHQLKTPLTPLKMYLQLLRHTLRGRALPPSRQTALLLEALDNTDHEYDRLLGLIDDLLDVSWLTAGRLTLTRERADLSRITTDVVARPFLTLVARARTYFLAEARSAAGRHRAVGLTRRAREQIVANLLQNALKYGSRPAGRDSCGAGERDGRPDGARRRDWHDRRKSRRGFFDRFSRAAPITNYGGLGLGLYIVNLARARARRNHRRGERAGQGRSASSSDSRWARRPWT